MIFPKDPIKLVTLNIQKGWSLGRRKATIEKIKSCLIESGATIVCLQEVVGTYPELARKSQFEFLADGIWQHFAYGKNAVHSKGHHGNAILSKIPFVSFENVNISNYRLEQRGVLHGVIRLNDDLAQSLHVLTVHLDLTEWGRSRQIEKICRLIESSVPREAPLIVCGDFNDWREKLSEYLLNRIGVREAYSEYAGGHARTFPTFIPLLKLDRIYYRNLDLKAAFCLDSPQWHELSDHLGLCAEFQL